MKLYLVQHGQAASKEENPDRPLTEQGRLDVERVAVFLKGASIDCQRVLHSGKLRAEQTASILAEAIAPKAKVEKRDGIAPNDEPGPLAEWLAGLNENIMIVGHLPFMSRMVSLLVTDTSGATTAAYRPGSVVCLERHDGEGWAIDWMIRPELLK